MTSAFFIQLRRELGAIFNSPMAYVIFFFFTLIAGSIFFNNLQYLELGARVSVMQMFFLGVWFWICMLIMVPLVTMRLYSEEYKSGTIELLLTAPVGDWDVVLSKYFAALFFYLTLWAPTIVYLGVFHWVTGGEVPLKISNTLLCYSLVILVGAFFLSIGLFISSLTKNQALAAFITFAVLFSLFFLGILGLGMRESTFTPFMEYISSYQHMGNYLNGIFDTRPVIFYLSGSVLFLALTQRVMAVKKLNS